MYNNTITVPVFDAVNISEWVNLHIINLPYQQTLGLSTPDERYWINWRLEAKAGKRTKVPYMPNGQRASSTDSNTWSTYAEVEAARNWFSGIGIVFTGSLLGVDLDHCIVNGKVSPEIMTFIEEANTYTEFSPSRTGLHLYLKLTEPMTLERNRSPRGQDGDYECYTSGRYFTVTNQPWTVSRPLRTVTPEDALSILRLIGYPWKAETSTSSLTPAETIPLDNESLLKKMFSSRNGAKIEALYNGDTSAYGNDESAADAALCSHLAFWTGGDASRIESSWLASPLGMREKTQSREDYRRRTIQHALEHVKETYRGKSNTIVTSTWGISVPKILKAVITCFSDIKPEPVYWLWPERIALGKLTLIAGDPGLGKSLLTTTLAATISKGYPWPVDKTPAIVGDVVLLSAEDDPADTIRPRLDAAGADPLRVHMLESIQEIDADGVKTHHMFSLRRDIAALESLLPTIPECKLLIIDPISAYLDETDSHRNAAVRGLLSPLAALATRYKIAIIAVDHLNKNSRESNALYRPGGSLAFVAAARAVYVVTKDKEKPDRRLVMPIKNNLAKGNTGMAYSVATADNGAPIIMWESEPVEFTANEAFDQLGPDEGHNNDTDWAILFLQDLLSKGPVLAVQVQKEARQAGIKDKPLRRAREKLGIKPCKTGFNSGWMWALPNRQDAQGAEDANSKEGALGNIRIGQ